MPKKKIKYKSAKKVICVYVKKKKKNVFAAFNSILKRKPATHYTLSTS